MQANCITVNLKFAKAINSRDKNCFLLARNLHVEQKIAHSYIVPSAIQK
jgi:hypothetical protein